VDERTRKLGLNEAVFREVNESLEAVAIEIGGKRHLDLVCECSRPHCIDRIVLEPTEYERLRADGTLFAVVAGHEEPDVEEIVERNDKYDVVRKLAGEPARIAELTDPRRG
jgi:hypothetical protein